jgi:energy-converting hydrogenase Eha subunit F
VCAPLKHAAAEASAGKRLGLGSTNRGIVTIALMAAMTTLGVLTLHKTQRSPAPTAAATRSGRPLTPSDRGPRPLARP